MLQRALVVPGYLIRTARIVLALAFLCVFLSAGTASAADLKSFLSKVAPADFFPEADRVGSPQGEPPIIPAYRGDQLQGFVYLNSDFANAVGYSGKPIQVKALVETFSQVTGVRPKVELGKRPYRPREMMSPWNVGPVLPGWSPRVSLEDGIGRTYGRA